MASMYDLTTKEGLHRYLIAGGKSPISIQSLSGGTANYVYRVEFSEGDIGVFKHAAPYLSSNRDFAFDQARMDFEAGVLKAVLPSQDVSASAVHAVRLIEYNSQHKLLCIEDGGERTLKQAYNDQTLDVTDIGSRLAVWLARLHRTMDPSLCFKDRTQNATESHNNNTIAVHIYRHAYNNLHTALTKFGHSTAIADHVNEQFGSLLESDDECLCHGDFWPGNVLLKSASQEPSTSPPSSVPALTIVDWEMSRRGTSATDVGQFAAEAFLLDTFSGNRGLRKAFLDAYATAYGSHADGKAIDKRWVQRMAVHWAVHITYWPTRVRWTNDYGTRALVDLGLRVLQAAVNEEWSNLGSLPIFADLGGEWDEVFREA
jgi:thiamine kinase-like enzyme